MWILQILLVVVIVSVRLYLKQDWIGNLWLLLGWILGYILAEADDWFYVAVCSPQELTCQRVRHEVASKNWRNAWGLLKSTMGERQKLPLHNIVTALVVMIAGIWLITSSGSLLAIGLVMGLGIRLYFDFLSSVNYQNWYWIFSRQFAPQENKTAKIIWGTLLSIQLFLLVRG